MKNEEMKQVLPMHLQFFADKDEEEVEEDPQGADDEGSGDEDGKSDPPEKTFTQAEVTAMMTKEKKEGRKAMLKQLGFSTEAEAKQAVALYTALLNSQKSEEDKTKERDKGLEGAKVEAEERAEAAENKLSCVMAGVKKDSVEDVLAIAKVKVTDEKSLDKVLAEMKKDQRYAAFFAGSEDEKDGTGSEPGHTTKKDGESKGTFGARLAKGANASNKKSSYF